MKAIIHSIQSIICMLGLFSCSTIPKGVVAVHPFEKENYLGTWYEIARFDIRFERDLNNTTATYSLLDNGKIQVLNKGYNTKTQKWVQALGTAKFVTADTIAMLKVSFFGPFYAGYNVIALDSEYQYALVSGADFKYLWILSRTTTIPEEIKKSYLQIAKNFGFKTSELLWIEHTK